MKYFISFLVTAVFATAAGAQSMQCMFEKDASIKEYEQKFAPPKDEQCHTIPDPMARARCMQYQAGGQLGRAITSENEKLDFDRRVKDWDARCR